MLLTLDLATRVGWTKGDPADTEFAFGSYQLPSTGDDIGRYADAFDAWVQQMMMNATEVVFEAPVLPHQTQLATVRKLNGLAWHTELVCHQLGIRCFEAHLQSIKKYFAGHGQAKKPDMIRAAKSYGYDIGEDDNQADAIGIRLYTIANRYKQFAGKFPTSMGLLGATQNRDQRA